MKYTGAEIIIKALKERGIKAISGIPGGANLPIYEALGRSDIKHILARHEQGAGFIAAGMARSTGKCAVCFGTSGPGATNLITALADCMADSVPIIAITGQVPVSLIGTNAFQEVDICAMSEPVTKAVFSVRHAEELYQVFNEAFDIAQHGRPGPVLVDVPQDVQLKEIEFEDSFKYTSYSADKEMREDRIKAMACAINESSRPILYIGGGIVASGASEQLRELAHKNSIPVVSTLMGLGAVSSDDELFMGMLGMHGSRHTNTVLRQTDLLIAIGVRFDDRATGKLEEFCPYSRVIHIDIDPWQINKLRKADMSIVGDAALIIGKMLPFVREDTRDDWRRRAVKRDKDTVAMEAHSFFEPERLIREIADAAGDEAIITTDVGQHQMWAAQYYPFRKPGKFLTSGGLGTMGFGLPAAIGAAFSNPSECIICISGDGSLLMNIQELATLAEEALNVKLLIFNNRQLGLVRQQQELFYGANFIGSEFKKDVDFKRIAEGFGIAAYDMRAADAPADMLRRCIEFNGPCILDIPIEAHQNVFPMVIPGAGIHKMIGGT